MATSRPKRSRARHRACVFLLVGTVLMAKRIWGTSPGLPLEARRKRLEKKVLEQYGDHLDGEEFAEILRYAHPERSPCATLGDQLLEDRVRFVMLVKLDKIDKDDIRPCVARSITLDSDHSGRLDAGRGSRTWSGSVAV